MVNPRPGQAPGKPHFGRRLLLALALLLLTVPWWPGLNGELGGLPAWAVYALVSSVIYALVVVYLLQCHWDNGADS